MMLIMTVLAPASVVVVVVAAAASDCDDDRGPARVTTATESSRFSAKDEGVGCWT